MVELGGDLSLISFVYGIWAAHPAPDDLWMFVVKLGQDLSLIVGKIGKIYQHLGLSRQLL